MAFLIDIKDNILLELKTDILTDFCRFSYIFIVCFSYPVVAYPLRQSIVESYFPKRENNILPNTIISLIVFAVSFLLGITLPGISFVFGLTGSTSGVMVILKKIIYLFIYIFFIFNIFLFFYLFLIIYFLF